MASDVLGQRVEDRSKAKVFISYSRKDVAFADRLEAALRARGFEPLIDRTEIYAFEEWWKRIEALIASADAVVFVISPDAVSSEICQKELSFAESLNKRFAPVVCRVVSANTAPATLARLNWIFLDDPTSFDERMSRLAEALETNIEWIRNHTEFGQAASRWQAAGRPGPGGLLLRPPPLTDADAWIKLRPRVAPEPTELTRDFIAASRSAFDQEEAAKKIYIDRALISQSRLLSDIADQYAASGDCGTAMGIALEALPDKDITDRPYVVQAETSLFNAYQQLQEAAVLATEPARRAVFTPDSRRVLTLYQGMIRIWDVETRRQLRMLEHDANVTNIAFSPDGRRVVSACSDGRARIWNIETGASAAVIKSAGESILNAAFSADGKILITVSDRSKRFWNVESGDELAVRRHNDEAYLAAFSADGERVLTASLGEYENEGERERWEIERSSTPNAPIGWGPAMVSVWLPDEGFRFPRAHDNKVMAAVFSPNGQRLATVSLEGTAKLFVDAGRWKMIGGWRLRAERITVSFDKSPIEPAYIERVGFSPDSRWFVIPQDNTARVLDAETGKDVTVLQGHDKDVHSAAFSCDGLRVITASSDRTVRIWEVKSGRQIGILRGHLDSVVSAEFSPDGQWVVSISFDRTTRMWNYETGREISDADGRKNWIALSHPDPTDRPNIVRTAEGRLQLNSTVLPEAIQIPSNANIAVFSPERRRLVICLGATAQIWDLQSDDLTANLTVGEAVWGAKFSNDGSRVVTISRHFWRVWNADRGDLLASIGDWGDLAPCAAIFNPDATRIVVASEQSVEVWDVNSGTRVAALKLPLDSHITMVSAECDLVCALQKNGKRRGWRIFPSTQSLVEHAKEIIPRGLTREQRHQVFLDPDPPAWCIEMDKWPYQS